MSFHIDGDDMPPRRSPTDRHEDAMTWETFIPSLALMTLGAFFAFAVMQFVAFSRRRSNREAIKRSFSDHSAGSPGAPDR
jgi:hypothetical protein